MWFSVSRGSHPYPPYSTERSPARVGKITPDGRITEFTLPDATAEPAGMASDRAGNLWLTENVGAETGKEGIRIRRETPAGGLTEKTLSDEGGWPGAIALGPEGNIWISESDGLVCKVLRVTPRWQIRRFTLPPRGAESRVTSRIESMTAGPDGNLWFVASDPSVLGRITPRGQIAETRVGENASSPESLVRGPGGSLWFNEWRAASITRLAPLPAPPRREH
jgi:virginiamycin B lyase